MAHILTHFSTEFDFLRNYFLMAVASEIYPLFDTASTNLDPHVLCGRLGVGISYDLPTPDYVEAKYRVFNIPELLEMILSYCSAESLLCSLRPVCKGLRDFIDTSSPVRRLTCKSADWKATPKLLELSRQRGGIMSITTGYKAPFPNQHFSSLILRLDPSAFREALTTYKSFAATLSCQPPPRRATLQAWCRRPIRCNRGSDLYENDGATYKYAEVRRRSIWAEDGITYGDIEEALQCLWPSNLTHPSEVFDCFCTAAVVGHSHVFELVADVGGMQSSS